MSQRIADHNFLENFVIDYKELTRDKFMYVHTYLKKQFQLNSNTNYLK